MVVITLYCLCFFRDIGLSVGQLKIDDKSYEIIAISELLDLIDIKNKIITIVAIWTQEEIANKIIDKKGQYLLKVKDNQKNLKDNIKTYFKLELKEDSTDIAIFQTNYKKIMIELKWENIICFMILVVLAICLLIYLLKCDKLILIR